MSCPKSEKRWLRVDINSLARTIVKQTDSAGGDWGAWNSWADCSTTCDVGFRNRNRICLSSIGACVGSAEEIEDCTVKNCDKEAGFLSWGSWAYWTKCEAGVDFCYRNRECPYSTSDKEFREACPGKSSQSVPCHADGCEEPEEEEEVRVGSAGQEFNGYRGQQEGPMQAPPNRAGKRGAAAGESSALGVGSIAALAGIAYMGKILFVKFRKKRKKAKKKKDEAKV
ncbi:A disintegrin and metalloproteinase with thrombospondin motifs adt-1-like [Strongylocentrotus purpuratus]|uniref:Uncharacterized protein n=1 Tax=Strongylocentrotus purpuratus TaxID=7668 RepID=A0A7M7NZS6_STRPU|nr:A disintegrin and metalloproteinase with thrombospondin motifs adt-1-like [Strongylocentrotus purpuratus]